MSKTETRIIPSNLLVMMTGVQYAAYIGKNMTLHYTDGTTEKGIYSSPITDDTDFFGIVSSIQSQRSKQVATQ
jgi:hypothetical protein